jgi:predicted nucleic acid-binding protein
MRIVVSDSSCIIDLRKVSLLDIFLKLPYEILIPDLLFEEELLKFTEAQKRALIKGGLKVIDMPGESVLRAQQVIRASPRLSVNDGFSFALAESCPGCILLTRDGCLRELAVLHKIEVHDILWIVEQIHQHKLGAADLLCAALRLLGKDPAVRLPGQDLTALIKRYESMKY